MTTTPRRRPDPSDPSGAHENQHGHFILPNQGIVNLESPRLWAAYRRYARNHRKIARLTAESEALIERMRYFQGGPEVDHGRA